MVQVRPYQGEGRRHRESWRVTLSGHHFNKDVQGREAP